MSPSRELPPGPHTRDGFGISFWTFVERDGDRSVSMAECSALLAELHTVMRTYPGELPVLAPATNDIPLGLPLLDEMAEVLGPGNGELLRASVDRLRPFLDAPGDDLQPLHGDVHPGNVIVTRDGPVWIDFEDVCLGPVEWDYALLRMFDRDLEHRHPLDPAVMELASDLRALHLAMCGMLFREVFGDRPGWDDDLRAMVGMLPTLG